MKQVHAASPGRWIHAGEPLCKREGEGEHSEQKPAPRCRLVIWATRATQIYAGLQHAETRPTENLSQDELAPNINFNACKKSFGCTGRETIFLGLSWVVLIWMTITIHLLDGFSSTSWKPNMVQVNFAPLTESLCLELMSMTITYSFTSFYISSRGNKPSSGSHLGVRATQLPC